MRDTSARRQHPAGSDPVAGDFPSNEPVTGPPNLQWTIYHNGAIAHGVDWMRLLNREYRPERCRAFLENDHILPGLARWPVRIKSNKIVIVNGLKRRTGKYMLDISEPVAGLDQDSFNVGPVCQFNIRIPVANDI